MSFSARIRLDSLNTVTKDRLTTFEVTYPRYIHSEMMTHRTFCLAGDSVLEFELPGGDSRVYSMRLDDFVDKWHNGARRFFAKSKVSGDLSLLEDSKYYTPLELKSSAGLSSQLSINQACREGKIKARKDSDGRTWIIRGSDFKKWRCSRAPHSRFNIQQRLSQMRIRQLNEGNGYIQTSTVVDCCFSGEKPVYVVKAGRYTIAGSVDHLIMTPDGYKRIGELIPGASIITVKKLGKKNDQHVNPDRLRKFGKVWRCKWQNTMRQKLFDKYGGCIDCGEATNLHIHHIVSVHEAPELTFDEDNIALLCEPCHKKRHSVQGWQGGTYLYGGDVVVDSVTLRGIEPTFDLTIDGEYPNFIANGVVVHNSRNSASSRAIPIQKVIKQVMENPAIPIHWGRNQKGMQARREAEPDVQAQSELEWLRARDKAVESARRLLDLGIHKQVVNRILEPWTWITVLISSTEYQNFFGLRCHPDAQPEIQKIATMMRDLYFSHEPTPRGPGEWHIPFVEDVPDVSVEDLKKIGTGRAARVSYLTHNGARDLGEDIRLHDDLRTNRHYSPFEHIAKAVQFTSRACGNFRGWHQYRWDAERGDFASGS